MFHFRPDEIFLVTGASSGIGKGTALLINQAGATVIATGRDNSRLAALQEQSAESNRLHCEVKDLAENPDSLPNWLMDLKKKFGKLKGLIHCAGLTRTEPLSLTNYTGAVSLFSIDYFAPLLLAKGFADRRVNTGEGASMTFIASLASVRPDKGQGLYGGAKAALVNTMQVMAKELAGRRIRVNCLSPGLVMTPMAEQYIQDYNLGEKQKERYPLGLGRVADVSALAAFMASDQARWITGQNYILDGGLIG
ncbi:MAG: SDR family oxidoreductase [Deltaproteobacteria bacterium]|jgi:NAD(P)-dependent dehydrogenase (short-subunit alcohol dehydrogenase family)|nr:SDR family oxidoreductase [Deltaproteobacteria bacterium]